MAPIKVMIVDHMRSAPGSLRRWHRLPPLLAAGGWEVEQVSRDRWRELPARLRRFRPRVIVSAGVVGFLPAFLRRAGLTSVFLVHDWLDDYPSDMGHRYGYRFVSFLERFAVSRSDLVTSPSLRRCQRARAWGKGAHFLPHGVDPAFDRIPPRRLAGEAVVGYVGICNRAKRVDRLVEAVRGLPCDLYLIGPFEAGLARGAPANAHFLGPVEARPALAYLKGFDIAVLTMDNDSCVKMFEYIKARRPILALEGKVRHALRADREAIVTGDLREGLKRLLGDPGLRKSLSSALEAIRVPTWPEVALEFKELVEKEMEKDG